MLSLSESSLSFRQSEMLSFPVCIFSRSENNWMISRSFSQFSKPESERVHFFVHLPRKMWKQSVGNHRHLQSDIGQEISLPSGAPEKVNWHPKFSGAQTSHFDAKLCPFLSRKYSPPDFIFCLRPQNSVDSLSFFDVNRPWTQWAFISSRDQMTGSFRSAEFGPIC